MFVAPRKSPTLEKLVRISCRVRLPLTTVSALTSTGVLVTVPPNPSCNRTVKKSNPKSVTVNGELVGTKSTPDCAV